MVFPFDALPGTPVQEMYAPGAELTAGAQPPAFTRVRGNETGSRLLYGRVDTAAGLSSPYVVGSDVPDDVDCLESPDHPACSA
jgi:hypothetical protein